MDQDIRGVRRVRHDLKLRGVRVTEWVDITPRMRRITLGGKALAGFVTPAYDDHVKLFFPLPDGRFVLPEFGSNGPVFPPGARSPARDYTPRRYDAARGRLDIDFVLHGDGPAARWAAGVALGHELAIGGPRGSMVVFGDFNYYLLVGDETALPAIGRRLEELPPGSCAIARIEVASKAEEQRFTTPADLDLQYVHRGDAPAGTVPLLQQAIGELALPSGHGFHFVAGEAQMVRDLRALLVEHHGIDQDSLKAAAYWHLGTADAPHH